MSTGSHGGVGGAAPKKMDKIAIVAMDFCAVGGHLTLDETALGEYAENAGAMYNDGVTPVKKGDKIHKIQFAQYTTGDEAHDTITNTDITATTSESEVNVNGTVINLTEGDTEEYTGAFDGTVHYPVNFKEIILEDGTCTKISVTFRVD